MTQALNAARPTAKPAAAMPITQVSGVVRPEVKTAAAEFAPDASAVPIVDDVARKSNAVPAWFIALLAVAVVAVIGVLAVFVLRPFVENGDAQSAASQAAVNTGATAIAPETSASAASSSAEASSATSGTASSPSVSSNPYEAAGTSASDYVLSDSDSRYYSRAELERMSVLDLYHARNEIYARHGRGFKNQDLRDYFASMPWYRETVSPEAFDEGV